MREGTAVGKNRIRRPSKKVAFGMQVASIQHMKDSYLFKPRVARVAGNFFQRITFLRRGNILDSFLALSKQGDIVQLYTPVMPVFLINKPQYVEQVLVQNAKNYTRDRFGVAVLKDVTGENLFTSDGEFWLKQRRLSQPVFHRKIISGFAEVMVERTKKMFHSLPTTEIQLNDLFFDLTLGIVGECLFSIDLDSNEMSFLRESFYLQSKYINMRGMNPLYPPLVVPTKYNRLIKSNLDERQGYITSMVRERRKMEHKPPDLMTMLIEATYPDGTSMDDEQIGRELQTMLFAGHETTANALSWIVYLLCKNPDALHQAEAEIEQILKGQQPSLSHLDQLTYLGAIIDEGLRLYPPVWFMTRQAKQADTFGIYGIPDKSMIIIPVYSIHRDRLLWEKPNEFHPERFLGKRNHHKYAFIPFGGGARLCIGKNFAIMEMRLVLATILQKYKVRLSEMADIEHNPILTLQISELPVFLEER